MARIACPSSSEQHPLRKTRSSSPPDLGECEPSRLARLELFTATRPPTGLVNPNVFSSEVIPASACPTKRKRRVGRSSIMLRRSEGVPPR
eukprot:3487859-Prymnesium_polylepis.3